MQLSTHGLVLRYGDFTVLDDVSMEVSVAGLHGMIGPNGAGKSTLFAVLSGFIRPNAGRISFAGTMLEHLSPVERARTGVGRTFQVPREFKHLSVRENLQVAARHQPGESMLKLLFAPSAVRMAERAIAERVERTLEFLKLTKVADQHAGGLSSGQKKLLELGRVLMTEPKFILLDEPYAGVNPVLIDEISTRIRELNTQGIGFLIIEHNLEALNRLVDDLYVMDRGRLIAHGTPQTVLNEPAVRAAYIGGAA
ncbi:branched-chain amino acid ABC transporter ATPase [Pandoraea thiooxydans]|uniref:ABC transporter ATP-binding protein n=1 Tax=Pandoraea thiooxydans TaxID=445709 RepID=A0A0G3EJN4_9BURK|nr:ABC transporter ATP-binding protein [Pandoraea thiooxydans]AKJ67145.1 ABC transporter ATP-binding protein [Pandoraea thiooxydans]APR94106.1 branched-chain amino acid ABC transporter ATPase [Pandoraea thiooxydans]